MPFAQPGSVYYPAPSDQPQRLDLETLAKSVADNMTRIAVKTETTSVTSSVTLISDPHLSLPVAANTIYHAELIIRATGSQDGDIQLSWSVPAGTEEGRRFCRGPAVATTNVLNGPMKSSTQNFAQSVAYGLHSTTQGAYISEELLVFTAGVAGTLQLQWSQNTSNATATSIGPFGILIMRKIGTTA